MQTVFCFVGIATITSNSPLNYDTRRIQDTVNYNQMENNLVYSAPQLS